MKLFFTMLLSVVLFGLGVSLAHACTSISWDANTEEDMATYTLSVQRDDATAFTDFSVGHPSVSMLCEDVGITESGHVYEVKVSASDTTGNESLPSPSIFVVLMGGGTQPPPPPPDPDPKTVCVEGTVDGEPTTFCKEIPY